MKASLWSRATGRKILVVLGIVCGLFLAAAVGSALPVPSPYERIQLARGLISAILLVLVWSAFRLVRPERRSRKWKVAEAIAVPLIWALLLAALGLWLSHLPPIPEFQPRVIVHSTSVETFTLSPTTPENEEFGVRLISIGPDGTTESEATRTSTRLTSTPGQHFASRDFGTQGLVLLSASSNTQTATFERWSCTTTYQPRTR